MLNLRDPKMLILISRGSTEAITTSTNHMVTTYLDPHITPTINEEPEEDVTNRAGEPVSLFHDFVLSFATGDIEMVPRNQNSYPQA
jgi:hypothetical protein